MTVAPVSSKLLAAGDLTDIKATKDGTTDTTLKDDEVSKEALMILGIDRGVSPDVTTDLVKEGGVLSACAVTL